MEHIEGEEFEFVSVISEGSSNGGEPIKGVRNDSVPPPFVTKLYDMVSNEATNATISWAHGGTTSFVIWNEQDFSKNLLPKMSRSNNFASFVSQLNNYGFKKISWIHCEYAHEWFQKEKRHLLKNIKRKSKQNTNVANEMTHEIEKLKRESNELDLELSKFKKYVDNTISDQKRIVQAMAEAIKSTFSQYHNVHGAHMNSEPQNSNKAKVTHQKASVLGQSSFSQSLVIEVKDDDDLAMDE